MRVGARVCATSQCSVRVGTCDVMKILGAYMYMHVYEGRCEGEGEREIDRDTEGERV